LSAKTQILVEKRCQEPNLRPKKAPDTFSAPRCHQPENIGQSMGQAIVRARVRPARVAVLINRQGTPTDFVLAVRFLSRLWGGMYAPIIPANPSPPDALAEFRLLTGRPDYVYSIGLVLLR
jgi:hypothetical protein